MSTTPRPRLTIPSAHDLSTAEQAPPELPQRLIEPSSAPPAEATERVWSYEEPLVAEELAREPKQRKQRKQPKHNSGSVSDPYICADGSKKCKTALNFTQGFADDFALFAAQYLRTSSKSAWAERVLLREIQRTRKRGGNAAR